MDRIELDEYLIVSHKISDELCEDFGQILAPILKSPEKHHINNDALETFYTNMSELEIVRNSFQLDTLKYSHKENTLSINPLVEGTNYNHRVLKETYAMFTDGSFEEIPAFAAISEGYRSNLAERMNGDGSDYQPYLPEKIIAKQIELIIGNDTLGESYFGNKKEVVLASLGIDKDHDLMNMIGEDYLSRDNKEKPSYLGEIQMMLTDIFFQKDNLTLEQTQEFKDNLYSNPLIFEKDSSKYQSIERALEYFNTYTKEKNI